MAGLLGALCCGPPVRIGGLGGGAATHQQDHGADLPDARGQVEGSEPDVVERVRIGTSTEQGAHDRGGVGGSGEESVVERGAAVVVAGVRWRAAFDQARAELGITGARGLVERWQLF